jgi:hypothetical protein
MHHDAVCLMTSGSHTWLLPHHLARHVGPGGDPPGIKLRAAKALEAVDYFVPGARSVSGVSSVSSACGMCGARRVARVSSARAAAHCIGSGVVRTPSLSRHRLTHVCHQLTLVPTAHTLVPRSHAGYWVFSKLIQSLSDIGYDNNNLVRERARCVRTAHRCTGLILRMRGRGAGGGGGGVLGLATGVRGLGGVLC